MDDRDSNEIRLRLLGGKAAISNLRTLSSVHQAGKVIIAGNDMPLTAGQKNGIKAAFNALATKVGAAADTLDVPTGKTGTVNARELAKVTSVPDRMFTLLQQAEDTVGQLVGAPVEQPDGTYRVAIEDAIAQEVADLLATLRDAVKFWIGVERLKVT
jgi:hypothetical protein